MISEERLAAVREALRQIVASPELGKAALSDPRRMANLLTDLLPEAPLEKTVLVAAADNDLADMIGNLLAARVPVDTAIRMAAESLAARTGLTAESCDWVAREIAKAIGVTPEHYDLVPPAPAPPAPPPAWPTPAAIPATPAQGDPFAATIVPSAPSAMPFGGSPTTSYKPVGWRRPLKIWAAVGAAVVVVAATAITVVLVSHNPKPRPAAVKPSVRVYHITSGGPTAVALSGAHAWVTQIGPDAIDEFNLRNGAQIGTYTGSLRDPWDIAASDGSVWVVNLITPGSVARRDASTGAVLGVLASAEKVNNPSAVAVQGSTVWVGNLGTTSKGNFTGLGSITELNASTGAVIKTIAGTNNGITYPVSIAVSDPYVWILDGGYKGGLGGITRIDTRTGNSLTRSGGSFGFERPASIAVSGSHVWVLNNPYRGPLSVVEINASDVSLARKLSGPQYDFGRYISQLGYRPQGIAAAGNRVWVANPHGGVSGLGSVTEINAKTGAVVRVLSGARYGFKLPVAIAVAGSQVWVAGVGPSRAPGSLTVLKSFR